MRTLRIVALAMAAALWAAPGIAHPPPRVEVREIIRLEGHRSPDAPASAGRMRLIVFGGEQPFAASARDAYSLTPEEAPKPADSYRLQGPRPVLARFAAARPDQSVVILGEHHPGSSDLFVLSIDLCPPQ